MLELPGHNRYAYSPIVKRPDYSWPGGKRLAFYVALNIEHFAFGTGIGMDPSNRSGQQTSRNFAWRDYGNRIGNWRLFEILDELELPATILLNGIGLLPVSGDRREDQSARRRRCRARPHQCRGASPDVGARRSARHRRMHRGDRSSCRGAADRVDGPRRPRIERDARPAQGGRLHPPSRLAVRRPADLDADPVGTAALRSLSDGIERRRHAGASRPYRPSVRRHDRRPVRGAAGAVRRATRWCSRCRCTASSSASRFGCGRCGRRSSIASPTRTGTASGSPARAISPTIASRCRPAWCPAVDQSRLD